MTHPFLPMEIPEAERTPLVNWLLHLIDQQQQVIENQRGTIAKLEEKVAQLEEKLSSLDEQSHCRQGVWLWIDVKSKGMNQARVATSTVGT